MYELMQKYLTQIESDIEANRIILPSLPEVALRVRDLSNDPNCSVLRLEHEIAKDAAITARLLKVANSAALSRGSSVRSLKQAVLNLGFSLVRSLVMQLSILQVMQSGFDKKRLEGFVASGLQISALCHSLAMTHAHLDPELAALGGLLHDIGKLPLRSFLEKQATLNSLQRIELERILHPAVGAIMLKHWQMPGELIQVACQHEDIERDTHKLLPDYVDIVIAANILHYGTQEGRYAYLAGNRVPALIKSAGSVEKTLNQETAKKRMDMALSLIQV